MKPFSLVITGDFTFSKVSVADDTSLNYEDKPQSTRKDSDEKNKTYYGVMIIIGIVVVVIIILICWWWYGL